MADRRSRTTMLGPSREDATGDDYTDAWGRRRVAVGPAAAVEVDVADRDRQDADSHSAPEPDVRSLSVDELAEKLRPRHPAVPRLERGPPVDATTYTVLSAYGSWPRA